jgi:hypothetical protein
MFDQKRYNKILQLYFLPFLVIKTLDPEQDLDPYRYPEPDSLEMLDLNPQHCFSLSS